jgi:hypothetical protein
MNLEDLRKVAELIKTEPPKRYQVRVNKQWYDEQVSKGTIRTDTLVDLGPLGPKYPLYAVPMLFDDKVETYKLEEVLDEE